jgi:predicted permease
MFNLIQDLKFGVRLLLRSPGFASVAVVSLALGIGANTAIFSIIDALLLRNLPVRSPEQLALLGQGQMDGVTNSFPNGHQNDLYSWVFFNELRSKNHVFSDLAAVESMRADVHGRVGGPGSEMELLKIRLVSGNYFTMLGVGPAVGRVLAANDDMKPGASPVAVLGYSFWEKRFGRDRVVGRPVTFNGTQYTIVGVAAPEFFGTKLDESPDLWIPLAMQKQAQPFMEDPFSNGLTQSLNLMGRLKPGVTLSEAQANVNVLFQAWLKEMAGPSPSTEQIADMRKAAVVMTSAAGGISDLRLQFSQPLRILMILVGLVLLIACANLANLLLARASGRQREVAVRLALGAKRSRLVRQMLSESLLLSLAGGALGVILAWWGGEALLAMVSSAPNDRAPLPVGPNLHLLGFTFGLSLLTGLLFGIAPALRMTRVDPGPSLKDRGAQTASRGQNRLGQVLIAGQVALALFLMIGAGLFVRTLMKLKDADLGFDKDRVVVINLDDQSNQPTASGIRVKYGRLEQRINALPHVSAASFSMLNYGEGTWFSRVWPQGVEQTEANAKHSDGNAVGARYFETMGMPLLTGRNFGPRDTLQSQRVAVVNATLAKEMWPDGSAVGKRVMFQNDKQGVEVIGVVRDANYRGARAKPQGMFFLSLDQEKDTSRFGDLVVRAQGPPEALIPEIRAMIRAEDPNLAIADAVTLRDAVDRTLGQENLLAKLAGFFGMLAMLLAAIGLYGVMAYAVARRTNEIGIRMALGARPWTVLRMVLREAMVVSVIGVAVGVAAALECGKWVSSQLYGLKEYDPLTISGAAAILLLVALLASALPALRAARLDPLAALREE